MADSRVLNLPIADIVSLYTIREWSICKIAKKYGCTAPAIISRLRKAGAPIRRSGNSRGKAIGRRIFLPIPEIADLYVNEKLSVETLASRYGCSGPSVATRLREAGVTIRASNDTKRGAVSPLRKEPPVSEVAIVLAYTTRPSLSISALARLVGCSGQLIGRVLDDYGVPHKTLSHVIGDTRNGPANPNWRDDLTDEERLNRRDNAKQVAWRNKVFKRDRFTCQSCDDADGGNLNGHHIESYNANRILRWEVSNGITLCETCHLAFHKRFGYGDNSAAQLAEFLQGERQAA